jgi:acetoin utilization deacetylase AcuC-like enzyme
MTDDRRPSKTTAYVSHSDCSRHDPGWGHPEHQGRLPAVARAVYRDMLTLFDPLLEVEARPAEEADLLLAHSPEFVERVRRAAEEAEREGKSLPVGEGTMVSGASWDAALAAAGSALTATRLVLDGMVRNAFCPVRPPGHRAGRDGPGGFGLFNSIAVAARHLRDRAGLERVLIVEWGAAAGTGTAEIVAADPGIHFLSIHQAPPGEPHPWPSGATAVPLPAGSTGEELLAALRAALDRATADFVPDFLLLSAGFDALASDPLGGLALEPLDFHALTRDLRERADALCAGRLVSVLEGGYDPTATGTAVVHHLRALAGLAASHER